MLYDAVQRNEIIADIVQHFDLDLGRRPHEEQCCGASKHLDIAGVRRKARNQDIGKTPLAADLRHGGHDHHRLPVNARCPELDHRAVWRAPASCDSHRQVPFPVAAQ